MYNKKNIKEKDIIIMWVEQLKNGKYRMAERYTDYITGKAKKISITVEKNTAQTRKAAQIALQKKIDDAIQKPRPFTDITLKELIEAYRTSQKGLIKESTYTRNYYVGNTIMALFGETTLVSRISAKFVKDKLAASDKDVGTKNELLTRFKAIMRWGYKNDYVKDISFLNKIEPYKDYSKREKIQDKFLESEELKLLLSEMKVDIWREVTKFLALTGVRIGELIALENSNIDLDKRIIHIVKTYDTNNNITTTTKTLTSTRDIYIQDELIPVIKNLHTLMIYQQTVNEYNKNNLFICDPSGENMHYDAYRKYLAQNSLKALGRVITPHTLRHTHASLLLENGLSIEEISRRLGHENSKITKEIYLHITEKLKQKENERIRQIKII